MPPTRGVIYHSSPGTAAAIVDATTAGRAKAHIDRTLFIVRTPDFPLLLRCLTVCCDLATINATTSHSTENVDELLKFPLWRKCCKRGSKSPELEEMQRKGFERRARPHSRA